MAFNLRGGTPPPNSVGATELKNFAVTTEKVALGAITPAQSSESLSMQGFFGTEATRTHTGDTLLTTVAQMSFIKNSTDEANWKKTSYQVKLQTSNATAQADFQLFIDGSLVGTGVNTTATSPTILEEKKLDISALADGNHLIELKLQIANAAETATLSHFELFLSKK